MKVTGIDPGLSGALVTVESIVGLTFLISSVQLMPITKDGEIDTEMLKALIFQPSHPIYLEKISAYAMSQSSAFSFGKTCGKTELLCQQSGRPLVMVEPKVWTKEMHQGLDKRLKPKEKSRLAAEKLFPLQTLLAKPKSKKPHDGIIDAALIAVYGLIQLQREKEKSWGL